MESENQETVQNTTVEEQKPSQTKKKTVIPVGIGAAGKVWREKREISFHQFANNSPFQVKTSWEKKQERRKKLERTKELQKSMRTSRIEEKREQIRRQEENKMRRQQNEIKNAQIQVIKNVGKLKKMSKKQLKQIKKTRIDKNGNVEYVDAYAK